MNLIELIKSKLFGVKIDPTMPRLADIKKYGIASWAFEKPHWEVERSPMKSHNPCELYTSFAIHSINIGYLDFHIEKGGKTPIARFAHRFEVIQQYAWGGVPATGRGHELILFTARDGQYVFEPQTMALCSLKRYPNKPQNMKQWGWLYE